MEVSVEQSKTIQTRLVLPSDTNHLGTIFGGTVLAYIDEIAAISAMSHARKAVVTVSIDKVDFISSAKVGDILKLEAFVYSTGRTSVNYSTTKAVGLQLPRSASGCYPPSFTWGCIRAG